MYKVFLVYLMHASIVHHVLLLCQCSFSLNLGLNQHSLGNKRDSFRKNWSMSRRWSKPKR